LYGLKISVDGIEKKIILVSVDSKVTIDITSDGIIKVPSNVFVKTKEPTLPPPTPYPHFHGSKPKPKQIKITIPRRRGVLLLIII